MNKEQVVSSGATGCLGISLGDTFVKAWKIFKDKIRLILIVVLIVQVPLSAASLGLSRLPILTGQQDFLNQQSNLIRNNQSEKVDWGTFAEDSAELAGLSLAIHFFSSLAGTLSFVAVALLVKAAAEGEAVDWRGAMARALKCWPAAVVTLLMIELMLSGLFLMLIVPMIVFYIYWTFAIQAVALNQKTGWGAIRYSMDLVRGRWWKVLGFSLIFGVMSLALTAIVNTLNVGQGNFFSDVFFAAVISAALSFFIVAYTVLFIDLERTSAAAPSGP